MKLSKTYQSLNLLTPQPLSLLLTAYCLLLTVSCSISRGAYHTVESGQTLWRIAKTYDVDIQDIAEENNIIDQSQIKTGQKIFIPGAFRALKVEPYKPAGNRLKAEEKQAEGKARNLQPYALSPKPAFEEPEGRIVVERWRFIWPVKGSIISSFGTRNGKRHDGIDISAPEASPVAAAADGEVIYSYSDNGLRGYGNMIMLKHKDGFITIYAHNKENLVNVGETVKKGLLIARLGGTGNAITPHLHFEVRKDRKPRNPLFFLP